MKFPSRRRPPAGATRKLSRGPVPRVPRPSDKRPRRGSTSSVPVPVGIHVHWHWQLRPQAAAGVSGASAVAQASRRTPGCERARRDGGRRRPKNRTQSASSPSPHAMLHAHRPLESGPRTAQFKLTLATRRLAWIPATNGAAAWWTRRTSLARRIRACATVHTTSESDTNDGSRPEIDSELRHAAANHQARSDLLIIILVNHRLKYSSSS